MMFLAEAVYFETRNAVTREEAGKNRAANVSTASHARKKRGAREVTSYCKKNGHCNHPSYANEYWNGGRSQRDTTHSRHS